MKRCMPIKIAGRLISGVCENRSAIADSVKIHIFHLRIKNMRQTLV
jgi:hypothetical protein